jgi:osmotically-inducible protein OsmY
MSLIFVPRFLQKILIFSSIFLLTGCSGVGVITSGAQAVYDRYDFQNNLNNDEIGLQINQRISSDHHFNQSHIEVSCFNYQVLLVGTTTSEKLRHKAAKIAAYTHDVRHVYNFIRIASQDSGSGTMEDDWITTKIRAKIIKDAKVNPNQIKVVTDHQTVYLMGLLTPKEADIAIDTAQHTQGVKAVYDMFEYINISSVPY